MSYQTYFYTANCGPGGYFNQTTYTNFSFVIGGVTYPFSAQQVVAQGFVSASCPNYTEPSSLPLTLPNTNNSSVPAGECVYTFSNGNGSSDCPELVTDTLEPLYKVVSILYEPPGNNSSQGLTSGTSEGTNSSIGQSFTFSDEYTFSSGITGLYNDSVSFGFTISSLSSDAFAQTWTNAQSLTTDDNSLDPQGKSGSTGINGSDAVQHSLDEISVWLNPMITTVTYSDYSTPVSYSIGYQSIPNVSNPSPDIVTVPVAQMMPTPGSITSANPYGTSTVPNSKIVPSAYVGQDGSTYTEPGLGILCKNLNRAEYNSGQCSTTDQCGCTPADFAQIVVQDPLLRYDATNLTANPVPEYESPLILDGSGIDTCGGSVNNNQVAVPAGSDCRFVIVPSSPGSNSPANIKLDGENLDGLNQSIQDSNILTYGSSNSYNVGLANQAGGIGVALKNQQTWTWQDSQSTGISSGKLNSVQILLKTSSQGCSQEVALYEDTLYHTFAFQVPAEGAGCN